MNPHFERASALLQTGRTEMAADELRLCLAEDPNFAPAHSMLALCLAELGQMQQAEDEAVAGNRPGRRQRLFVLRAGQRAHGAQRFSRRHCRRQREPRGLTPMTPTTGCSKPARALPCASGTWRLKPPIAACAAIPNTSNATTCAHLRWCKLVAAKKPNIRSKPRSTATRRNVGTHAHQGWALLNAGDRVKALEHYREAMRLDPNNEFARMGIVETLKARNFIYRAFLRYFLFMSRQKGWVQWAIILGVLFGQDALRMLSDALPVAAPYIMPLYYVLIVLVLGSWMANPMFNLLLRLDREGRHALSETQIRETNLFGGVLALGIVCALAGWVFDVDLLLLAGVGCGFLLLPLACTFAVQRGWPRTVMVMGSATLALMGAAIVGGAALAEFGDNQQAFDFSMGLIAPFLWGCVLSTWASLILSAFVPKR
jgi:tetratricopeptide (TPR) repeat protein